MIVIRYVTLAALVVWLGGMISLGAVVAPSTFRVLQATDPATGRMLAGTLFGEILRIFHLVAYTCGALMIIGLLAMKFIGPPPSGVIPRIALVVLMLALELYSGGPVSREISAIQAQVSGSISQLPESDARRSRFDTLHQRSENLMKINLALALVLLFWYVRE
jgi:hypothetical protein